MQKKQTGKKEVRQKIIYPKKLYTYAIWFQIEEKRLMYFMHQMYNELPHLYFEAMLTIRDLKKSHEKHVTISPSILIIPCTFYSDVQHKKSYWQGEKTDIGFFDRINTYIDAVTLYKLYTMLIVPTIDEYDELSYASAMVIKSGSLRDLDTFMRFSNYPVPSKFKNSALYTIEEPYGYDLTTNKIVENRPVQS